MISNTTHRRQSRPATAAAPARGSRPAHGLAAILAGSLLAMATFAGAGLFAADKNSGLPDFFLPIPDSAKSQFPQTLSAEEMNSLLSSGEITVTYANKASTRLCPSPGISDFMATGIAAVNPTIGVESLFAYPLPSSLSDASGRDLRIYNLLHRFRTMEGIQYYSASRKQMRTFYTKSFMVTGPSNRNPLPDPVYETPEKSQSIYIVQDDLSFGSNLYHLDFDYLGEGGFHIRMRNAAQMWYGIAPVLGAGAMELNLVVQVSADGKWLEFYGNAGLNAPRAFGLADRARDSFYNRVVALYSWFLGEVSKSS